MYDQPRRWHEDVPSIPPRHALDNISVFPVSFTLSVYTLQKCRFLVLPYTGSQPEAFYSGPRAKRTRFSTSSQTKPTCHLGLSLFIESLNAQLSTGGKSSNSQVKTCASCSSSGRCKHGINLNLSKHASNNCKFTARRLRSSWMWTYTTIIISCWYRLRKRSEHVSIHMVEVLRCAVLWAPGSVCSAYPVSTPLLRADFCTCSVFCVAETH